MRVLIGFDGSEGARSAIDELNRAGLPQDVQARVVSVADVFPHLTSEFFDDGKDPVIETSHLVRQAKALARHAFHEAKGLAAEGAARLRERFPNWKVEDHVIGDSPYWALIKESTAWKANLIVVGSHGKNAFTRALLGGVSQQTMAYAPCSVRVGRCHPEREKLPLHLLLGVDFSADAELAVDRIVKRDWPAGTKMTVATVLDAQIATALPSLIGDANSTDEETVVLKRLQAIADRLIAAGLEAAPMVIRGNPRKVLVKEAERLQVDCIYLGAKGLSRIKQILLGSVATSVANRATCSVEIVR